jgi:hypothetical protein
MGYGWGYGRGRGWRYHRRRWRWRPGITPEGWSYLGPCRCGWGSHAYWQTPEGEIVPPWGELPIAPSVPTATKEAEIEDLKAYETQLKQELEEIRKRLESLEKMKEKPSA